MRFGRKESCQPPTVLTLLGFPVGRDMPGQVMRDAFRPQAGDRLKADYIDSHGPALRSGDEPELDEDTRKWLRSLGYIQ
jgi:hypothetical protein